MTVISTPDLTDVHPEALAIELQFTSYGLIRQFGGQAVTITCPEDNSLVKQCVAEEGAGRVIVVDGGGSLRRALLGDMLAEQAAANGLTTLKGHRSVGGMRASIYNAMPEAGVDALIEFMAEFERTQA